MVNIRSQTEMKELTWLKCSPPAVGVICTVCILLTLHGNNEMEITFKWTTVGWCVAARYSLVKSALYKH